MFINIIIRNKFKYVYFKKIFKKVNDMGEILFIVCNKFYNFVL